jgi:hypothetical protein
MPVKTLDKNFAPPADPGIVELSLMLSRDQFDALEERARTSGLSVAQFLRRLVFDSISEDASFV